MTVKGWWGVTSVSEIAPLFGGFIAALKAKDAGLFARIGRLHPSAFWREWKKVHPEDFPQDGASAVSPASIVPLDNPESAKQK